MGFIGKALKLTGGLAAVGTVGVGVYVYQDEGCYRSAKCLGGFLPIIASYTMADWQNASLPKEEQQKARRALHRVQAEKALAIVLDLKGYYLKMAQTMVGSDALPKEYEECFKCLLDSCPSEPFNVIKDIVEAELGVPLDSVYDSFDPTPLGSASIGQVHRAELKLRGGGSHGVVVKVQYPKVEAMFNMDVQTMKIMCALVDDYGDAINDLCDDMGRMFKDEFDYTKEASMLRECSENLPPHFRTRAVIPLPIDVKHPLFAQSTFIGPKGLCTRKVLTMEEVKGTPIKAKLKALMSQFAQSQGISVAQLEARFKDDMQDPEKLKKLLSATPTSEAAVAAGIMMMQVADALKNVARWARNLVSSKKEAYQWSEYPLNGPRITKLLFDIHGHQIFHDGIFNSDPHAGNILIMDDGRLGLVDYGGACRLSMKERKAFAKLVQAIPGTDNDAIVKSFIDLGASSKKNDHKFMLFTALLCFDKGFTPEVCKRAGVPEDLGFLEIDPYLNSIDKWQKFPPSVMMLQRCSMVLLSMGSETGAGGVSASKMWEAEAGRFLATA